MNIIHVHHRRQFLIRALVAIGSITVVAGIILLSKVPTALANTPDINNVRNQYTNFTGSRIDSCSLCHTASIPALNSYGADYKANGRSVAALIAIEGLDSDGDGFSNLTELKALTFPGDAADKPSAPTATMTPLQPATNTPTATRTPLPSFTPTKTALPTATRLVPPTATRPAGATATLLPSSTPTAEATFTKTPAPGISSTPTITPTTRCAVEKEENDRQDTQYSSQNENQTKRNCKTSGDQDGNQDDYPISGDDRH